MRRALSEFLRRSLEHLVLPYAGFPGELHLSTVAGEGASFRVDFVAAQGITRWIPFGPPLTEQIAALAMPNELGITPVGRGWSVRSPSGSSSYVVRLASEAGVDDCAINFPDAAPQPMILSSTARHAISVRISEELRTRYVTAGIYGVSGKDFVSVALAKKVPVHQERISDRLIAFVPSDGISASRTELILQRIRSTVSRLQHLLGFRPSGKVSIALTDRATSAALDVPCAINLQHNWLASDFDDELLLGLIDWQVAQIFIGASIRVCGRHAWLTQAALRYCILMTHSDTQDSPSTDPRRALRAVFPTTFNLGSLPPVDESFRNGATLSHRIAESGATERAFRETLSALEGRWVGVGLLNERIRFLLR